ncbi:hypothetical protein HUT18_16430 [Streptomyces sp. NA04227]|uniref:hypothetical protein n=1 Tax=Streptomyces sp. NA04227 TaxID=2742136 RepID=UPI001590B574|nr:hypothetical protein [Streptomyces sp. NA04227]QKW07733.1 hypothetical protein HUT18_16430 [Streptomyces sp. NA04227]
MDTPTYEGGSPEPAPPERPPERQPAAAQDPLAVALGNASLLGLGYLFLGRRKFALAAVVVGVVLVNLYRSQAERWCEVVLLLWWVAVVAHGWYLARGAAGQGGNRTRQRVAAASVTAVVALTAGLLRLDAHAIESDVSAAREDGDCAKALEAQDRVGLRHRLTGATVVAEGDATADACELLYEARSALRRTGDTRSLARGFTLLDEVLADSGNTATARTVLNEFLGRLDGSGTCETVTATDWIREDRKPTRNLLDSSADAAENAAPAALLGCADSLMDTSSWDRAKGRYQRLVEEFPQDSRVDRARKGLRKAIVSGELEKVDELVDQATDNTSGYCAHPTKYSDAPSRKGGRTLFLGDDAYTKQLPGDWRTDDPTKAAMVACAGEADYGDTVDTCSYEYEGSGIVKPIPVYPETSSPANLQEVSFHKVKIPVKVYELRTGKLVSKRDVQISGGSCPRTLDYEYYMYDTGPDEQQYVSTAKSDVRAAFSSALGR